MRGRLWERMYASKVEHSGGFVKSVKILVAPVSELTTMYKVILHLHLSASVEEDHDSWGLLFLRPVGCG